MACPNFVPASKLQFYPSKNVDKGYPIAGKQSLSIQLYVWKIVFFSNMILLPFISPSFSTQNKLCRQLFCLFFWKPIIIQTWSILTFSIALTTSWRAFPPVTVRCIKNDTNFIFKISILKNHFKIFFLWGLQRVGRNKAISTNHRHLGQFD